MFIFLFIILLSSVYLFKNVIHNKPKTSDSSSPIPQTFYTEYAWVPAYWKNQHTIVLVLIITLHVLLSVSNI